MELRQYLRQAIEWSEGGAVEPGPRKQEGVHPHRQRKTHTGDTHPGRRQVSMVAKRTTEGTPHRDPRRSHTTR